MIDNARYLPTGVRHVFQRARAQEALADAQRLHMSCCGRVLPDWTNLDLHERPGSLRFEPNRPLPARSESIDCIYAEHFIEHLTLHSTGKLLMECRRVLVPGGVLRLSTPDLRGILHEYSLGRTDPGENIEWTPLTPCRLINDVMRQWDRQFLYDEEELKGLLHAAGFAEVRRAAAGESSYAALHGGEPCADRMAMIIEAVRGP